MQGFLVGLWQGVGTEIKTRKLLGTRLGFSLYPQSLVFSMNQLKSLLFANQLSWLLYSYSRGWSFQGPQVNFMALPASKNIDWLSLSLNSKSSGKRPWLAQTESGVLDLVQSTLSRGTELHNINMAAEGPSPWVIGAVNQTTGGYCKVGSLPQNCLFQSPRKWSAHW